LCLGKISGRAYDLNPMEKESLDFRRGGLAGYAG
jgi:hypothetical protein